jgi:toxin FitB
VIVLDTTVLSELIRARQAAAPVFAWVASHLQTMLCTTSVNKAEILYGIAVLPEGGRRSALAMAAERMFDGVFEGRVLPFDADAAAHYARIVACRRNKGRPIANFDAQIAAIARAANAQLATRNVAGFADCGLTLINPWNPE